MGEEQDFGIGFSISLFSLFKWEGRKKRRKNKARFLKLRYGNISFDVWKSLFVYVWVRKTLTLIIKVLLGWFKSVLWLILSLSYFGMKIFYEKGEKCPISVSSPTLFRLGEGVLA